VKFKEDDTFGHYISPDAGKTTLIPKITIVWVGPFKEAGGGKKYIK